MERSELYVQRLGPRTSPTLVLVHGAPDRSSGLRGVLPYLADSHAVIYDRRGYGRSLGAAPAGSMMDHADDLLAILDDCPDPPIVVAHSFGSNPTMLAASVRPSAFAAIGLWEPPIPWVEWWPKDMYAYIVKIATSAEPADDIETMYRGLLGEQVWNSLPPEVQAERRGEGAAFQVDMASELEAPFNFEDVHVPALVGYGTDTVAHHLEAVHFLVEHLPEAEPYEIPDAGHFAPRTQPQEFAAFIRAVFALAGSARPACPRGTPSTAS